jgi:glycosyltransferase involved in cell wall biosynthesis
MMTVESSLKILSILIPVYNGEETIRDALEDLVRRGLNYRYEVIVCDDGSTDSSLREAQLVANQHCGISVVENGSHGEKVSAIKAGLQRITTPYVLLLDADSMIVELKNRYLDRLVEKMHARQWAAVGFKIQSSSNRLLESLQALEYSLATDSLRQTLGLVVCLSGAGVLWEADSLEKVLSRHTGVFEGDDLESTILATLLNLKIGYETQGVIVTTRPKRSLGALFKQRALIWDVGLIRRRERPSKAQSVLQCFLSGRSLH